MRRTTAVELLVAAAFAGVIVRLVVGRWYGELPPLRYIAAIFVGTLAVVDFALARRIKAAVSHQAGARPVPAIFIARCVALAKASSLGGAVFAGAAAGFLVWALPKWSVLRSARSDSIPALALLVAAALLVVAGLLLERAAIHDPDQRQRRLRERD